LDLEQRIVAAAFAAMPVAAPMRRRFSSVLSMAGGWAMRPQTAMAALFLVTLGTSVLLMRGRSSRAPAIAPVTVVEEGSPAPAPVASAPAASSYYAQAPSPVDAISEPGPSRERAMAQGAAALAPMAKTAAHGAFDGELAGREGEAADRTLALARKAPSAPAALQPGGGGPAGGAGAEPRFALAPTPAAPAEWAAAPVAAAPAAAAPAAPAAAADVGASSAGGTFAGAMAAYRARRFDEAKRSFDSLASGDANADLWAARALRESRGCAAAASRFDQVSQRAAGTTAGWDAQLDAARCYAALGNAAGARARLRPMLAVDGFRDRAQAELDRLGKSATAATPSTAP
jgi:hypothetical protein